jgi:hypothetical protein
MIFIIIGENRVLLNKLFVSITSMATKRMARAGQTGTGPLLST